MKIKNSTTMQSDRLAVSFSVKSDTIDKDARTFEGLASVWGRDLGDDDMHKGAFKETLKEWRASGRTIALLNNHKHWDIDSAIGQLLDAKETDEGLWTKWEVIDGPDGDRVLERIRPSPRTGKAIVTKMSIGFNIIRYEIERTDKARWGEIRHLHEVELLEVSLVLFPMAPGASVDASSVKSLSSDDINAFITTLKNAAPATLGDDVKKNLRRAASHIGVLLGSAKGSTETPAHEEEPTQNGNPAEAPAPDPAADSEPDTSTATSDESASTGEPDGKALVAPLFGFDDALQVRLGKVLSHPLLTTE